MGPWSRVLLRVPIHVAFEGKLLEPIASLSVLIYNFAGSPFEHQVSLAWAASLVLVTIVLILNVVAQVAMRRPEEH